MLVFWHCLNLNGPRFDCEINISLRLIVGVGCHSHYFQSYCLSGIQRELHPTRCALLTHTCSCVSHLHPDPIPESGMIHAANPRPTLLSLIQKVIRAGPLTMSQSSSSLDPPLLPLFKWELNKFPKILSTWLCLNQQFTSASLLEGTGFVWKMHNS